VRTSLVQAFHLYEQFLLAYHQLN